MTYSWSGEGERVFVTEWTYVVDDTGRMAALLATSEAKEWELFEPTFAQIRDSVEFEEMLAVPDLEGISPPPEERISYQYAPLRVALSYPGNWLPLDQNPTLFLAPPATLAEANRFNMLIISAPPETFEGPLRADTLLEHIEQSTLSHAAPASPISASTMGEQQMAIRYYVGLFEQQPLLILVATATRGELGVVAMSIMDREGYQRDMEAIISSLIVNPDVQAVHANYTVDWSPDGERLAFTSRADGVSGIYILQLGNGTARRLTGSGEDAGYADWSPDGNQIVYNVASDSGRHLFLRNASGENRRQLTAEPGTEDSYPDWSPEGDRIVFARYDHIAVEGKDVDAEIMLLDPGEGGTIRPLNVRGTSPAFSPDGRQIAFVSDLNEAQDIYVMDTNGGNIVQITDDPQYDLWPAWSPDGSRILYVSASDGNWDLYTIHVDGSGRERLTDHPAPDYAPAWSPDGEHIAFDSNRKGVLSIYVMNADGTDVSEVTVTGRE